MPEDTQLFCYGRLHLTGEIIGIRKGETGYFKTYHGVRSKEWLRYKNSIMGIDEANAEAMSVCAISGDWGAFDSVRESIRRKALKPK